MEHILKMMGEGCISREARRNVSPKAPKAWKNKHYSNFIGFPGTRQHLYRLPLLLAPNRGRAISCRGNITWDIRHSCHTLQEMHGSPAKIWLRNLDREQCEPEICKHGGLDLVLYVKLIMSVSVRVCGKGSICVQRKRQVAYGKEWHVFFCDCTGFRGVPHWLVNWPCT